MVQISVVSPVYQAESTVPLLVSELMSALASLSGSFEIILVDDRSRDGSWEAIRNECKKNPHIKGLRLSRNFGQHPAISAGLSIATGEWIVVMDCDLQDKPDQISALYKKAIEGYDIVFARRRVRQDSFLRVISSRIFYSFFSYLTESSQDSTIANFGIYRKKVINAILDMNDTIQYFPAMVQWVGFKSTSVDIEHSRRLHGSSNYNLRKLLRLAFNNIIAFSDKPLRLSARAGLVLSLISVMIGLIYFAAYLLGYVQIVGYASLIISIWLTAGLNMFVLGLVGIYVGKSFEKIKGRPVFVIDENLNID